MSEISRLERGQSEAGLEELRLERGRLALIEQRIREILAVLKSLNSMVSFRPFTFKSPRDYFYDCPSVCTFLRSSSTHIVTSLSLIIKFKLKNLTKCFSLQRISPRILGSMVISAVEAAYDEARGEVDVAVFLNLLFSETREYERQKAESILTEAMEAVTEAESDESSGGR